MNTISIITKSEIYVTKTWIIIGNCIILNNDKKEVKMIYQEKEIKKGIKLHQIKTDKFKQT